MGTHPPRWLAGFRCLRGSEAWMVELFSEKLKSFTLLGYPLPADICLQQWYVRCLVHRFLFQVIQLLHLKHFNPPVTPITCFEWKSKWWDENTKECLNFQGEKKEKEVHRGFNADNQCMWRCSGFIIEVDWVDGQYVKFIYLSSFSSSIISAQEVTNNSQKHQVIA